MLIQWESAPGDHIERLLDELADEMDDHRHRRVHQDIDIRMPPKIKRKPVELPTNTAPPTTFAVELDSVEIARPIVPEPVPTVAPLKALEYSISPSDGLPELDIKKMRLDNVDPADLDEKMLVEEIGLTGMLEYETEEKIVVDDIMLKAERFLAQQGYQVDRQTSMRRRESRKASVAKHRPSKDYLPTLSEPLAVTYHDLPPSYHIYSKFDILEEGFMPGKKIAETFRLAAQNASSIPGWPQTATDWLRVAAWWLLKSKLMLEGPGTLDDSVPLSFIDLAKASWILTEVVPPTNEAQAQLDADSRIAYAHLWRKSKDLHAKHQPRDFIPFMPQPEMMLVVEPQQPEEQWFSQDSVLAMDLFDILIHEDKSIRYQSFVRLDLGRVRPDYFAAPLLTEMNYLLIMSMETHSHEARLTVHNQAASLPAHIVLTEANIGPELTEDVMDAWVEILLENRPVWAGFATPDSAIPYLVEWNIVRRELFERWTALFSAEVDKVRYVAEDRQALGQRLPQFGWTSAASIKLMEKRNIDDENERFRQMIIDGKTVTTR